MPDRTKKKDLHRWLGLPKLPASLRALAESYSELFLSGIKKGTPNTKKIKNKK